MSRLTLATVLTVAAFAFTIVPGGAVLAQSPAAKDATDKTKADSDKLKSETDANKASAAQKADERKAAKDERRKAKADRKAKASSARAAVRDRQKQCGAEWKEARSAGKLEKNMTWPKYWSACNTRLKAKAG